MKKFAKIFTMIAICFVCAFGFVACGKNPIVSAVVKSGTLATAVVKNETIDTSNVKVVLTYKDKTTKEVTAADLKFSDVDTSTTGEKDLTITYEKENYSFVVKVKVVATEMDVNSIISLTSELLRDFNENKNATDEYISFKDQAGMILVGNQNEFNFRIAAAGKDALGKRIENLTQFRTIVTLERLVNQGYQAVNEDAVEDWVTINTIGATFKFKDNAIGEQFRISVKAANPDESAEENQVGFMAEVKIVDAFNVYTAKELSVYDNARENGRKESFDWSAIKTELGLTNVKVNGIVLQDRIVITKDDVPADVFWTDNTPSFDASAKVLDDDLEKAKNILRGTPIDYRGQGLFTRKISDGEEFNFYGNYFTVDLKEFPKMVMGGTELNDADGYVLAGNETTGGKMMTAHLCVFYNYKGAVQFTKQTVSNWENLGFYGNGGLSKNKTEEYTNSGGIILMKSNDVNFKATNTLTNNFYIGYFFMKGEPNDLEGHFVVDNCRGFNSYQCLFYLYGAKDVTIKLSEFKSAGGPAIIADHVGHDSSGQGGYPTNIKLIESEIESKVTGKEPWFATYNASAIVTMLASMNAGLYSKEKEDLGKDLIVGQTKDGSQQMNIALIFKSSKMQSVTPYRILGTAKVYNTVADYEANKQIYALDLDHNAQNHASKQNMIDIAMGTLKPDPNMGAIGNIYFQDILTGKYVDAGTAQGTGDPTSAPAGERLTAESKYVNVYFYLGMAGVFGLTPKAA